MYDQAMRVVKSAERWVERFEASVSANSRLQQQLNDAIAMLDRAARDGHTTAEADLADEARGGRRAPAP